MKNDYDISKQFQDDLIKAYNSVAPFSWSQEEAYRKAVKQPAPRYYISPAQAAQILSPMVRGDFSRVNEMMPNRRRMYYSLFERVIELSEKRAFIGKGLKYIVQFAVSSPAPEFFCSYHTLDKIRDWLKHGNLDEEGRVKNVPSRDTRLKKLREKRERIRAFKSSLQS